MLAMDEFMRDHPYLTFFLGVAAIHGVVTIIRGRESIVVPPELFGVHPAAPPMPQAPYHPAAPRATYPAHLTGAPPPGGDYSFTRRPGYNNKDY